MGPPAVDWTALICSLRPGSRTILWQPSNYGLCLDFARRGFRLMILHREPEFNAHCRSQLREAGLASQLMGTQVCALDEVPSLAKDFYEIFVFCQIPQIEGRDIAFGLAQGSIVVAPAQAARSWSLGLGNEKVERLPSTFIGFRLS